MLFNMEKKIMISPTTLNPLLVDIHHKVQTIMQSNSSRTDQKIRIIRIISSIILQNEKDVEELLNTIKHLERRISDLSNEHQTEPFQSSLREKNEEIKQLAIRILELEKENSFYLTEIENSQHQLVEASSLIDEITSELEQNKEELCIANHNRSALQQRLNESFVECERVRSQVAELRHANEEMTTETVSEQQKIQQAIEGLDGDNNHLISQFNALKLTNIKLLAAQAEVIRLKKAYIEDTMVRWLVPNWPKRVEEELARKNFFFTYFNPISSTPWLTLCDQKSLNGRENNITRWLGSEMRNHTHLTEIQALTQLLNRLGYGYLIRSEEVYIQEYMVLHNNI